MIKLDLENLNRKLGLKLPALCTDVSHIEWRGEDCSQTAIWFYHLHSKDDLPVFFQRVKQTHFALCFINTKEELLIELDNVFAVADEKWMLLQKEVCDLVYPYDFSKLNILAVTGTNGKTTCAWFLNQLITQQGMKTLMLGTLGVYQNTKHVLYNGMTSSPYIKLRSYLYQFAQDCDYCIVEASSHGLDQERFFKLNFKAAIWTNLSQDHLDYHQNMDRYFAAKEKIFDHLVEAHHLFVHTNEEQLVSRLQQYKIETVNGFLPLESLPDFLKVNYNKVNFELCVALLKSLKIDASISDVMELTPPPGRFWVREKGKAKIIIDFAHTPAALENILRAAKESFSSQKLWVVFGAGGDRDVSKRALMGNAAAKYADKIFLTNDNPRSEDPIAIINDIASGINELDKVVKEPDRKKIILKLLSELSDEILVIAGKGHEETMEIAGKKYSHSDTQIVIEGLNYACS